MTDDLPAILVDVERTERLEFALSRTLRTGVYVSLVLMGIGLVIMLIRHPDYLSDPATLDRLTKPGAGFPHSLGQVGIELFHGRGRAVMTLGLLVLILTPIARVFLSLISFVIVRDWRFVAITAGVFAMLIVSLFIGEAH